ncbi:Txe/YoeB family addiction module toxin [Lentilactobacillus otakiensis]|uniref:Txe/YoeB family addiction module toxin n=1 Tax=Lentilactobacillus otakiensis TaxID=481720 RepID=UPI0005864D36|nr:Txe/YoeB family addiction module toxin [Lentilactobacillus otakiensis]MBZ3777586.1 Txe/YoeB family addiction module toxin [Lentilactobacillus otakiensis]MDV3519379.1 Txe/YoeB family addiction module toxin [Lentilactobacillus otakiensis]
MSIEFLDEAWDEYVGWQAQDHKTLKRINNLIKSIKRDGLNNGIGKPERLRYQDGWPRRINDKDRLVYTVKDNHLIIVSYKNHYE